MYVYYVSVDALKYWPKFSHKACSFANFCIKPIFMHVYAFNPWTCLELYYERADALNRAKTKGFVVDAMSYKSYRLSTIDSMLAVTLSARKLSLTRNDRWLPPNVDNLVSLQPFAAASIRSILSIVFRLQEAYC